MRKSTTDISQLAHHVSRFTTRCLTQAKTIPLTTLLFLLLLAIAQPLWHGYRFGVSDHSIQFSIMNRIMDGTLYPNDAMLETAKGYVSFYPRFMVVLIKLVGNMEALYFVLHILSHFLYFTLLYHISLLLFDKTTALLCVLLMTTSKAVLGGSSIHFTGLYPSFFTLPLALLAVYLFLRERYTIAYAIVGIILNLHTLVAGYTVCMLLCYSGLCVISKKTTLKAFALNIGVFAICASPALIWIVSTRGEMTDEWIRLLKVRSSHHSFPFSWDASYYVNFLLLLAAGGLSFLYAPAAKFHRKMLAFALAVTVLCAMGLIFAEYYPVKSVLRGQFFRSTNFLTIFCVMYVANYIRHSWANSTLHKVAVGVIFIALLLPSHFNWLILGLILALIADNAIGPAEQWSEHRGELRFRHRFYISLFVLTALLARNFAPHSSFPNTLDMNRIVGLFRTFFEESLLMFVVCLALALMSIVTLKQKVVIEGEKTVWKPILHSGTLLIALLIITYVIPSAYGKLHPENRYTGGWRGVQIWAKENTKPTDLFLTPPNMTGFRIFSQRPIVGEWKDGTQQYFDAEYSYEWWRRMQDLKSESGGGAKFNKLGKEGYTALAEKYGATYLVLPSNISPDLPKAYDNGKYAVYRLNE